MKAPLTQEEKDYRSDLSNKVNAISSIQGLFTDIEDKARRLRILKALLEGLNYGDSLFTEIDAEITAIEEAAKKAEEEAALEGTDTDTSAETQTDDTKDTEDTEDTDLGTLADLESFNTNGGNEFLTEDQEILNADVTTLLTEEDLPSPIELDAEKDFSENN
jgi:hypothetical protein